MSRCGRLPRRESQVGRETPRSSPRRRRRAASFPLPGQTRGRNMKFASQRSRERDVSAVFPVPRVAQDLVGSRRRTDTRAGNDTVISSLSLSSGAADQPAAVTTRPKGFAGERFSSTLSNFSASEPNSATCRQPEGKSKVGYHATPSRSCLRQCLSLDTGNVGWCCTMDTPLTFSKGLSSRTALITGCHDENVLEPISRKSSGSKLTNAEALPPVQESARPRRERQL